MSVPMFIGDLEGDGAEIRSLLTGKAGEAIVQVFLAEHNLEKLALHWTQGGDIPWDRLHAGKTIHQVATAQLSLCPATILDCCGDVIHQWGSAAPAS